MDDLNKMKTALANIVSPPCAGLTSNKIISADKATGRVKVEFEPQPLFENLFGNIQGGLIVGMLDVPISLVGFLVTDKWLPTIEIKTSYLEPARLGHCTGEAIVLKAGKNIVFVEAKLWGGDNRLAAQATASLSAS